MTHLECVSLCLLDAEQDHHNQTAASMKVPSQRHQT